MDFSCSDRLSILPDELICQILSSLPTKDAAVVSLSSKKMRSAFMYLTTLDFDDSPLSCCAWKNPQLIERFQIFKAFVDNVLQKSQSPYLTKFILEFGWDMKIWSRHCSCWSPDLEATILNAWISFPLSRCGVREIELRIHVRRPAQLPSALFTCETLEVLKLDTNLYFDLVSSMASFKLPNLKVLQLYSMIIPEDDFVSRLVSNCPSLHELCIDCRWEYGISVVISSPSLQKLVLLINKEFGIDYQCELLNIDTPNLQYFEYKDILAFHNSVTCMKAPVQASISIDCDWGTFEGHFREMVNLVQAVCNVQHLRLTSSCLELLDCEDLKNELPTFHNLGHLEINTSLRGKWDGSVLFEFLRRSPVLEVLEFPEGIDPWTVVYPYCEYRRMIAESEYKILKPHLKRIVIKKYRGTPQEVELVRFLLEFATALEELLIICDSIPVFIPRYYVDPATILKKFPMASSTCLLIVQ